MGTKRPERPEDTKRDGRPGGKVTDGVRDDRHGDDVYAADEFAWTDEPKDPDAAGAPAEFVDEPLLDAEQAQRER